MSEIDSYIKEKRLELSASILSRRTIYLDINYWIRLRDHNTLIDKQIFNKVTELVKSGKCIFPISEVVFFEILKQKDKQTLISTLELVDKFSGGIAIIDENGRRQLEFLHFFRNIEGKDTYNLKELVWTRLVYIVIPFRIPEIELPLQKSFFNFLSNMSLLEVMAYMESNGGVKPFEYKDDVERMNREKEEHQHENNTAHKMFLTELLGFLDLHKEALDKIVEDFNLDLRTMFPEEWEVENNKYPSLIYHGFKRGTITKELPMFKILPTLYAAVRWDKGRKYTDGNDTPDFMHAACALPYCDYFFTEKELRTIIAQQKLDTLFECVVESDPYEVLKILNSIS